MPQSITYDTSTNQQLSETGTFNHAALASGRRFDPRDFVTDEAIWGLRREAGVIWGTLRDVEGTLYSTMRRIGGTPPQLRNGEVQQTLGGNYLLLGSRPDGTMRFRKEVIGAVDSADVTGELTDEDTATFTSAASAHGRPMHLELNADTFRYSESGVIDAVGKLAAPPLQWYLPGRYASNLYLTQTWLVEATVLGKPARGFLFWEEAWMMPGGRLYLEKDPLNDAEYFTWYSWANHWDDGSCEVGHFLFGQHDFHVGVTAHSDGTVTSAHTMDAVVNPAEDGYWHDGIDYRLDGVPWRCEPDPQGRMTGLGPIPNPQQEGRIHRVDDTRMPVVWMAWGENVPERARARR